MLIISSSKAFSCLIGAYRKGVGVGPSVRVLSQPLLIKPDQLPGNQRFTLQHSIIPSPSVHTDRDGEKQREQKGYNSDGDQ